MCIRDRYCTECKCRGRRAVQQKLDRIQGSLRLTEIRGYKMEIYKGTATFSGIAIGKILYYSRGEYQIRQCLVSNIKKEIQE